MDPVLKAIEDAAYGIPDVYARFAWPSATVDGLLNKIRTAYLASQKTAVEFAVETLNDTIERQDKRIAELETRVPKTADAITRYGGGHEWHACSVCNTFVGRSSNYCRGCGCKLNWRKA